SVRDGVALEVTDQRWVPDRIGFEGNDAHGLIDRRCHQGEHSCVGSDVEESPATASKRHEGRERLRLPAPQARPVERSGHTVTWRGVVVKPVSPYVDPKVLRGLEFPPYPAGEKPSARRH